LYVTVFISGLIHIAIVVWAMGGWVSAKPFDVKPVKSIPVDIISPSEFTRIKAGTKAPEEEKEAAAKAKQAPQPVKRKKSRPDTRIKTASVPPQPEKTVPKPEPEPKQKAEPEPEPEPKPKKKAEPKPKQKPKAAEKKAVPKPVKKPRAKPKAKASKPSKKPARKSLARKSRKNDFNADRIAALLNKIPDAGGPVRTTAPPAPKPSAPARGLPRGLDATMSINEIDAFRAQISRCWSPPVGGLGAERLIVKLQLNLNEDGTLSRQPRVMNSQSSPFFMAAADSAVRAVWQCQPYLLPANKFGVWRDMVLNFDPRDMYGG